MNPYNDGFKDKSISVGGICRAASYPTKCSLSHSRNR